MSLTPATFRTLFPAFGSTAKYADPMVEMWLALAAKLINADRWGELADMGQGLITAHNLVLESTAQVSAQRGGNPGSQIGILTSKSAGGVSASYDASSSTEQGAGHWNQTTYGARYYRLSRMMGAGPIQVGGGDPVSVSAWSGPMYFP